MVFKPIVDSEESQSDGRLVDSSIIRVHDNFQGMPFLCVSGNVGHMLVDRIR